MRSRQGSERTPIRSRPRISNGTRACDPPLGPVPSESTPAAAEGTVWTSPVDENLRLSLRLLRYSPDQWLIVVRDVTQLMRLEHVRRDFVANVSHELKTPVGALALLSEAVSGSADDPQAVRRFALRMQHRVVLE